MFHAVRIKNLKLGLISVACVLALLTACLLLLRAAPRETVKVGEEKVGLKINRDEDVEEFLEKCGCSVEGCVTDEAITIPKNWNEVYTEYNDLQKQQGFDLRPYKGKSARRLVYALSDSDDHVTVLIADDRIIAADLCSPEYGSVPRALTG